MTTEALVVTHTVSLRGADAGKVATTLAARPGVRQVYSDEAERHLHITHDLGYLRRREIEKIIDAAGGRPTTGIFAAFQRSWARFTEDNVLASVGHPYSSCCNRPPK